MEVEILTARSTVQLNLIGSSPGSGSTSKLAFCSLSYPWLSALVSFSGVTVDVPIHTTLSFCLSFAEYQLIWEVQSYSLMTWPECIMVVARYTLMGVQPVCIHHSLYAPAYILYVVTPLIAGHRTDAWGFACALKRDDLLAVSASTFNPPSNMRYLISGCYRRWFILTDRVSQICVPIA